jgi:hypothetical protein
MKPSAIRIERMLEEIEARLVPPPRKCLSIIIHEGDDKAMEKALAEHVACHPEDAGRTVKDFRWVVREIVRRQGWRLETVDGVERAVFEGDTDGRKPSETETPETIEGNSRTPIRTPMAFRDATYSGSAPTDVEEMGTMTASRPMARSRGLPRAARSGL